MTGNAPNGGTADDVTVFVVALVTVCCQTFSPKMLRREFTGPTPHSVAVRAKFPSWRTADHLVLERQRQEDARDKNLEFSRDLQTCDIKSSWLQSSDGRFLRGTIQRGVRDALDQQEVQVHHRRERLRALLQVEEQQLLQEAEEAEETPVERQAKMRERARALRERRERERQQLVSDKMDQLFSEQCEELRTALSRRREQQVCEERAAQVRSRQEQLQREQEEEHVFQELWEADRRAKEQQEAQRAQQRQQRNTQQLEVIKRQMEDAAGQRRRHAELREEEAAIRLQQQEMQRLQQQRERQQALCGQQSRRRDLDQSLRLKVKRLAREQQEELQLDMKILQTLLLQETDQRQEAAQRKVELRAEQQRYRQYLSEELARRRGEEQEAELLVEEKLKEVWRRRGEQSRLQREARDRLMEEVMEARSLQIQHKLDLNLQKQVELTEERDELNRAMEEMKLTEEEEKTRQKQTQQAHLWDLRAQVRQQQQVRSEQRAQAEREQHQGLIQQEVYNQRRDQILSRPLSHTTATHPFRRAEGCRSAS